MHIRNGSSAKNDEFDEVDLSERVFSRSSNGHPVAPSHRVAPLNESAKVAFVTGGTEFEEDGISMRALGKNARLEASSRFI